MTRPAYHLDIIARCFPWLFGFLASMKMLSLHKAKLWYEGASHLALMVLSFFA